MKYIGPFFRTNNLSKEDISSQLFHFSKESVKSLVFNSRCGICFSSKNAKSSSYTNDISTLSNFSPLLCIYRKSSPIFIHNKISRGFDESTFKKEVFPATNALMTICLLELNDYYSNYLNKDKKLSSLSRAYINLSKMQLEFYSKNLRNNDGVFIKKKNISDLSSKNYNLINLDKKFDFLDQAFMMNAYYIYSKITLNDEEKKEYDNFALQILDMFIEYKDKLYDLSFSDGCKLLVALNLFYKYSKIEKCKTLIIDYTDYLIVKFDDKNYYINSIDSCSIFAICLKDSYKHTQIINFLDKSNEITEKLKDLFNEDINIFSKLSDKKEVKYSSFDICFYILALLLDTNDNRSSIGYKNMCSHLYRKLIVNSGLVTSFPEAPTLDDAERYKNSSMKSEDMFEESFFRIDNTKSPDQIGIAPIFVKNIVYSKKKNSFSCSKNTFDSGKNMFINFMFIHYLKDLIISRMEFTKDTQKIVDDSNKKDKKNSSKESST